MSFEAFARAHGLILDQAIPDARWHRTRTEDKPRRANGAYLFDGQRGVVKNFATMTYYAAYRDGAVVGKIDKAELRARRVLAEVDAKARQAEARAEAQDMLHWAAFDVHPYLAAKGFPQEKGFVFNGYLLIPMREFRHYKQINSLQRIAADGTKLFLPGGKAKGSVYFLGPRSAPESWFCEGYADGLTIALAAHHLYRQVRAVVCFSAGNLAYVAKEIGNGFIYADNDISGAGQRAAESAGLPWTMSETVGNDVNDDFLEHGIGYVVRRMRALTAEAA